MPKSPACNDCAGRCHIDKSCPVFSVLVSRKPQGSCRGFGDIAIRSGQGRGAEKDTARLTFERLLFASSSLWLHPTWYPWLSEACMASWTAARGPGHRQTPELPPQAPHLPPTCSTPSRGVSHPLEKDLPGRYRRCPFPPVAAVLQASCPPSLPPTGALSTSF